MKWSALIVPALLLACTAASADDGEINNKRMTGGNTDNQLTVLPGTVFEEVSHAEHAFTDMMKFYVPSQAASGEQLISIPYNDIDGNLVEELPVAKPLVNVFIYGPAVEVPDTAFAHSFMDTFAAVSLDDGTTWKTTNLSQHADKSSFTLGVDGVGGGDNDVDELPVSHTQLERDDGIFAFHKPGMDYPYSNQCTDCHGATLEGGHHGEPSCYSCHGPIWKEDAPDGIVVIYIEDAYAKLEDKDKVKLKVFGQIEGVEKKTTIELINGVTEDTLAIDKVEDDGRFKFELEYRGAAPCTVAVIAEGVKSSNVTVVDKKTGEPIENCVGKVADLTEYPGGAYNVFHATAGNKVLVAWPSRFCRQGQPAYALAYDGDDSDLNTDQQDKRDALEPLLGIDVTKDLYLTDLFGVAGSQRSIDFADEGYPQAGEVPFGCVWTARGVLLPGDDPRTENVEATHMVWTKPERLTSGRRDPNRIEVKGVAGAGFVITWQEDPDGLRPGQGLGPGEGWSGAVAHDKTDIWYSFIPWEYFDMVENPDDPSGAFVNIAAHDLLLTGRPQPYVPMAVPMRLSNNDKCVADEYGPTVTPRDEKFFSYCNEVVAQDYGLQDFCADTVLVPTGPQGTDGPICVNAEGLPNIANTASTRPRLSLQGYDDNADGIFDSAWVIVAAEESKGLGRYAFLPDGTPCDEEDPDASPDCGADIGKNQWYFSFDMGDPATSVDAAHVNGLVQNLVKQGNLLNQPEVDWRDGEFYDPINTVEMWDFGAYNYDLHNTEIARRASLLVQSIGKAGDSANGLVAMPSWKQGVMRQGGPADTMVRRIVATDFTQSLDNNPYAFSNMQCAYWRVDPGTNVYYPGGVCGEPAINLSGVVPDTCLDDATGAPVDCPTVDFSVGTYGQLVFDHEGGPILRGYIQGDGDTTRVLTWHQCPSDGTVVDGNFTPVSCGETRTDEFVNLRDQSWYNPLDISKGHRGFIDGDFVMFLYAWSPTWRLNAKGNDRYDLYVRRSFDGGETWQTTPSSLGGDGTVTCENYRSDVTGGGASDLYEPAVCFDYPAGGNEQARNITQHKRMRVTTLDPRYAATPGTITDGCVDGDDPTIDIYVMTCDDQSTEFDSDLRDPSRYFMVFETGDNSTVQVGEAEPLDLFYGRAVSFGDDYEVWAETDSSTADASVCYPSDPHGADVNPVIVDSGFCNEFDRMNTGGDTHSSEANLEANPDGSKLYSVWGQWVFGYDEYGKEAIVESDAMARRLWWIDDYISANPDLVWTLPGTNQP